MIHLTSFSCTVTTNYFLLDVLPLVLVAIARIHLFATEYFYLLTCLISSSNCCNGSPFNNSLMLLRLLRI